MLFREKETHDSWDKQIVRYTIEHVHSIRKVIKHTLMKSPQVLNSDTVEEILMEIYNKLYRIPDFSMETALLLSGDNKKKISLESYVGTIAKRCTQAHVAQLYDDNRKNINKEIVTSDSETLDLMDVLSDDKAEAEYDRITCTLDEQLKLMEPYRYAYGVDIFLYLYIRLNGLEEEKSKVLFSLLDIYPIHIASLQQELKKDSRFRNLVEELASAGNILTRLGRYVFNRAGVDRAIHCLKYA